MRVLYECMKTEVCGVRMVGRTRKTWQDVVSDDMKEVRINYEDGTR